MFRLNFRFGLVVMVIWTAASALQAQGLFQPKEPTSPSRISEAAQENGRGGAGVDGVAIAAGAMAVPLLISPVAAGLGTVSVGPALLPGLFRSNAAWLAAGLSATALVGVLGAATMTLTLVASFVGPKVPILDAIGSAAFVTVATFAGAFAAASATAYGLSFVSWVGLPLLFFTGVFLFQSLEGAILFTLAVPVATVSVASIVGGVFGAIGAVDSVGAPDVRGDVDVE